MEQKIKICILGGGFGGFYTALYFAQSNKSLVEKCQITLVEPKDNFLFSPLLYEVLTDELKRWEIAPSYQKLLLGYPVDVIKDKVTRVEFSNKEVLLQNNVALNYDYLVIAVGRKVNFPPIEGLKEYALTFRSIEDAEVLKNRLEIFIQSQLLQPKIAVIGGGANGIEIACKTYDYFSWQNEKNNLKIMPQLYVIDRGEEILENFGKGVQKAAYKALEKRNISLLLTTDVIEIEQDSIKLKQEDNVSQYPIDLVLWTAGTATHEWIEDLPCQRNKMGQLLTYSNLKLIDYPEVLAVGDVASIKNQKEPTTAQVAYQQASTAAKNLQAMIQRKSLKKFSYLHLGNMMTLGKGKAIISSFGINIVGTIGGFLRRLIYVFRLPTMQHRLKVLKNLLFGYS